MLSLSDLLSADTEEQIFIVLIAFLTMVGFEPTSWQEGSVPRTMLRAVARAIADQARKIAAIAAGGYLDTAKGPWLDLLAWSHYRLTRQPAVATRGKFALADAGGGPHTVQVGQLLVRGPGNRIFRNLEAGTVPLNGSLPLEFEAIAPGAAYNLVTGSALELLTPLPTVTVTNPPGLGGTWLTRSGADTEGDANFIIRCVARWPGLSYLLSTALTYRAAALAASPEVTRARVFPHTPSPGYVRVVVAGASGPVSAPALAAVQTFIDERLSVVVTATVDNVTLVPVPVQAVLVCKAAYAGGAQGAALVALAEEERDQDMGDKVFRAQLIETLMGPPGMVNVVLSAPAVDTVLQPDELASFVASLTVQAA